MTRFNISLDDGVEMVLWALEHALGGEIFVPKIPSYRVSDVAEAVGPNCKHEIIGMRPGEKIHEEMITPSDSPNTVDLGPYFAILPASGNNVARYIEQRKGFAVEADFSYNSGTNPEFLTVGEIRKLITTHVESTFVPV
jgi:FlaA1/EpsC-like NDP-sugar epimerase